MNQNPLPDTGSRRMTLIHNTGEVHLSTNTAYLRHPEFIVYAANFNDLSGNS